jgi:hypothetical protein
MIRLSPWLGGISYARTTMETVWIYTDGETVRVFATKEAAENWEASHEADGFAYEYPVEQEVHLDRTNVN